jgi:hypothetical protein
MLAAMLTLLASACGGIVVPFVAKSAAGDRVNDNSRLQYGNFRKQQSVPTHMTLWAYWQTHIEAPNSHARRARLRKTLRGNLDLAVTNLENRRRRSG